jgi:hypothetical protein
MTRSFRLFILCVCSLLLVQASAAQSQSHDRYREFVIGSSLASVAKATGADPVTAKVIHRRPAMLTDLEWRPRYHSGGLPATDPVDVIAFKFYDDQLFTIVVDYDRRRTEGMTSADMIDAISASYGMFQVPSNPVGSREGRYGFPDTLIATWGDTEHSVSLLRVTYPETFRLVVRSTRLAGLADLAGAAAVRLDADEAPQRELDRQKKQDDDSRAASEKARDANKATFKP